jgi:RNA polymerase sigma factor (sigma-70 family)
MRANLALPDTSDEDLAACIAQRDLSAAARLQAERAFLELYDRYQLRLLHFLAARTHRADVEDTVQETWRRVWQHLPTGFQGGRFQAWLFTIAENRVRDQARKKRPVLWTGDDVAAPEAEELSAHADRQERLRHCMEQLTHEEASVVRNRLAGQTYPEVSADLGIPVERAYKLFHQAKQQLQGCVQRAES